MKLKRGGGLKHFLTSSYKGGGESKSILPTYDFFTRLFKGIGQITVLKNKLIEKNLLKTDMYFNKCLCTYSNSMLKIK